MTTKVRIASRLGVGTSGLRNAGLVLLLVIQALSAMFFVYDIFGSLLGIPTRAVSWMAQELFQVGAALGLTLGMGVSGIALARTNRQLRESQARLSELRGAFHDLLEDRFAAWRLTPAERDVAFFVMKGFSTAEIAAFRKTSEGTVKAQAAAIYRKSGVTSRAQLVTLFVEDLMEDRLQPKVPVVAA